MTTCHLEAYLFRRIFSVFFIFLTAFSTHASNKPAALTSLSHKFSTWVEATSGGQGQVNLKNWHSASVNQTANPSGLASILGTPSTSYTYDANGNTIQSVVTFPNSLTLTANYSWDHKNQLVRVEFVGYASSEFSYDGLGRRVRIVEKDAGGAVTSDRHYLWDGLRIAQERNAVGTPATIFYPQGEMRTGNVKYYYVRDHQGSVREVHDAAGNVVARYDYDPYGYPEIVSESVQFDFLYTGHLYHRMSGLYLAPYRAYNPQTGKWLSEEPLGLDGPNMYHYGFGSPLNGFDPDGLSFLGRLGNGVAGAASGAAAGAATGAATGAAAGAAVGAFAGGVGAGPGAAAGGAAGGLVGAGWGAVSGFIDGAMADPNFNPASAAKSGAVGGALGGAVGGPLAGAHKAYCAGKALTAGAGAVGGAPTAATPTLTAAQAANLKRFNKRAPANSTGTAIDSLGDDIIFTAISPGRTSGMAVYQKVVNSSGRTTQYIKTTFDNRGNYVHIKDKVSGGTITF